MNTSEMKKFEYKNLHDRPILSVGSAQEFSEWALKKLNEWGAEGWQAIQVQTPATEKGFTGDLFVLAMREVQAADES